MAAFVIAMLSAALASALLAVLTEKAAYLPLRKKGAGRIAALLTALGVSILLQNVGMQVFTAEQKGFPDFRRFVRFDEAAQLEGEKLPGQAYVLFEVTSASGKITQVREVVGGPGEAFNPERAWEYSARKMGGIPITGLYIDLPLTSLAQKVLIIVTLAISFVLLWLLVKKSRYGRAMRAVSYDPETAKLMGIASGRIISMTFFVGAFCAGIGGMIWGLRYGKVEPFMGFMPGLKAFIAAGSGGIGALEGAILGGVLLGMLEVLIPAYLPSELSGYKDAVAFFALIAILIFKPSGLLGKFEGQKV